MAAAFRALALAAAFIIVLTILPTGPSRHADPLLAMVTAPLAIVRRRDVLVRTGLPQASMYRLISEGKFPKPITLSPRRVGWIEEEVNTWIQDRIAESRGVPTSEPKVSRGQREVRR